MMTLHMLLENIEGIGLAVLVNGSLAAVIALPFYGIYRLINSGLKSIYGWLILGAFSLVVGSILIALSIIYCMPQSDYANASILLVLGGVCLNIGIFFTLGNTITSIALRSKFHLINIFIAIGVCAGFLIYDFAHLSQPLLFIQKNCFLAVILYFMAIHVLPWLRDIIYFGYLGCFNDDFFKFKFMEIYLEQKTLYHADIPESIDMKDGAQWVSEQINIIESSDMDEDDIKSEATAEINVPAKETISQYSLLGFSRAGFKLEVTSCYFTTAPIIETDASASSILMPQGYYAVCDFEGTEMASRNFLRDFYVRISLAYPSFITNRSMFALHLKPPTREMIRIRVYGYLSERRFKLNLPQKRG